MAKTHKKKNNFSFLFFFLVFALAGAIMLIGGFIFLYSSLRFQSVAVEITGTVTEISSHRDSDGDIHHSVRVSYSYEGQNYDNVHLGFYSSSMYEGKDIPLLVDPDNPGHIASRSGNAWGYGILLGMGFAFLLVGTVPSVRILIGFRRDKELLANGRRLQATVESIDLNSSVSYNGRHPYVIFCTYQDVYNNVTYRFKSGNLRRHPGFAPGDTVDVYVDPQDYSKYTVVAENSSNPKVIDYT